MRQRRKEIKGFKVGVSQNRVISLMTMVKQSLYASLPSIISVLQRIFVTYTQISVLILKQEQLVLVEVCEVWVTKIALDAKVG